jgi:hypothetical protein
VKAHTSAFLSQNKTENIMAESIEEAVLSAKTELTIEEKAINFETLRHVTVVRNLLNQVIREIMLRQEAHDQSKFSEAELATFVEFTPKLKKSEYGSDEYKGFLKSMKPALDNHYACNRHHPEHFENGIDDMNLVDVIEMLIDWKAATLRHNTGDIIKSIQINEKRFNMSPQLIRILLNTVRDFKLEEFVDQTRYDPA